MAFRDSKSCSRWHVSGGRVRGRRRAVCRSVAVSVATASHRARVGAVSGILSGAVRAPDSGQHCRGSRAHPARKQSMMLHAAGRGFTVVPDLRAEGLTFKRAQRLSFRGQELIQLVYLPASGDPVALCVMREKNRDSAAAHGRPGARCMPPSGMRVTLGYVLVAKNSPIDLLALGRRVASHELPALYGRGA